MKIYEMLTTSQQTPPAERTLGGAEIDLILEAMDQRRSIDDVMILMSELDMPRYVAQSILDECNNPAY